MSENNQFQPYRYPQAGDPQRQSLNISASRPAQSAPQTGIGALLRRPLFATTALLATAAVFAAIMIFSYPSSDDAENVPVVTADGGLVREAPQTPGGMEIANADSTIFQQMRTSELAEKPPVENLLDLEQPVSKDEAFGQEARAILEETPSRIEKTGDATGEAGTAATTETVASAEPVQPSTVANPAPDAAALATPTDAPAAEATASAEAAPTIHAPASSPETLAFVRSVLDKKEGEAATTTAAAAAPAETPETPTPAAETTATAEKAATVEPAAGAASSAKAIEKGTHFVQLASVTSSEGAEKEWGKIKTQYAVLSDAAHRVNRADLGEKGIYYRIQAGPFSKAKAEEVCNSIKAQKPGGCLVVQ